MQLLNAAKQSEIRSHLRSNGFFVMERSSLWSIRSVLA